MSALTQFLKNGIKSIQRGTAWVTTTTTSISISAVNVDKSVLTHLGVRVEPGASLEESIISIELQNSTTIRARREATTKYAYVSWELVEYY